MIYANSLVSKLWASCAQHNMRSTSQQQWKSKSFTRQLALARTIEKNLYKLPNPHYTVKRLLPGVCGLSFQLVPALSPSSSAPLDSPGFTHGSQIRWTYFGPAPSVPFQSDVSRKQQGAPQGTLQRDHNFQVPVGPTDVCLHRLWPAARRGGSLQLFLSENFTLGKFIFSNYIMLFHVWDCSHFKTV